MNNNGPIFNNIKTKDAFRSSLGIEETINTMQANLCQAINSNTPYAYYFAFILWCFYDYEKTTDKGQYNANDAYAYLKRQNFFFSLSHILKNHNIVGAIGYNYITTNIDLTQEKFAYEKDYLQSMQSLDYYLPGLDTLQLLKFENLNGERLSHPTVTEYGKKLCIIFESTIINTDYFLKYKNTNSFVPKDALVELANTISINLANSQALKEELKEIFFNNKYVDLSEGLIASKDLILYVTSKYGKEVLQNDIRNVLFDYFSPKAYAYEYPKELNDIIKKWELVTARRYFTLGLSIIWKYMLPLIEEPTSFNEWLNKSVNNYNFELPLNDKVGKVIDIINLDYKEREEIINKCKKDGFADDKAISDGLKLLLYVYKRFVNRNDLNNNLTYIVNSDSDTLPLYTYFNLVNNYLDKPLYELMEYIMMNYLILQNEKTAYRKLVNENKNSYHFEKLSDKYVLLRHYYFNLGRDRLVTLTGIMEQLGMLDGVSYER